MNKTGVRGDAANSLYAAFLIFALLSFFCLNSTGDGAEAGPVPLLAKEHPVDWWFVFKFNSAKFPQCGGTAVRQCTFGGDAQPYGFGQQFVYASSESPSLQKGVNCLGDTTGDPVGATFDEVYNGSFHYVVWNDQFYDHPHINGCSTSCGSPWGHSKGLLAWDDSGSGLVLQVTTPSWPGSGSAQSPRKSDGNTLGCVNHDDVTLSQHFFALKLTKDDVVKVLSALQNASVVTDPTDSQIVADGGPQDIQDLVNRLGKKSASKNLLETTLSSGVRLISKPSHLNVPPWQMVSARLGGAALRTATFWTTPQIPSTTSATSIDCWDDTLGKPGAVENAETGQWSGTQFGLTGGPGAPFNHAKIGVSTSGTHHYAIFGDMNQQGSLTAPKCSRSQNGRGGLFYVIENQPLSDSLSQLITTGAADGNASP